MHMTMMHVCYATAVWVLLTSTVSADVRLVDARSKSATASIQDRTHLRITGEITEADVTTIENLISVATEKASFTTHSGVKKPVVFLDSHGGDLLAAIRIGRILRDRAAWIWVDKMAECASACVFILAGGVQRSIVPGARIRLHRPYFEPRVFAELSSSDAQAMYRKLSAVAKQYLSEMGMPDALFERMLRIPSQNSELLTTSDLEKLRLTGTDPAFEEWDRANMQKSFGPERARQIEGFAACLNSGTPQRVCEDRWQLKLGK